MSASIAGDGLLGFSVAGFNVARSDASRTIKPPGGVIGVPTIIAVDNLGTIPDAGVWLGGDSTVAYGDVWMRLGLNFVNPVHITMRFPGGVNNGAPTAAAGMVIAAKGFTIVAANVGVPPTTDVQWTLTFRGGGEEPRREWRVHYEWNVMH